MTADLKSACAVTEALSRNAAFVQVVRPGRWRVRLGAAPEPNAVAAVAGEWLTLSAPLPADVAPRAPWTLLQFNVFLPGGVRIVLPRGGAEPQLRVDVRLDGLGGEGRLAHACDALRRALSQVADRSLDRVVALPDMPPAAPDAPGKAGAWPSGLEGFPWPHRALEDGRLRVDVDTRGGRSSVFASHNTQGVRLRLVLMTAERMPTASSKALGAALLAAADAVYLARPTVERDTDGMRIGFDAVTAPGDGPDALVLAVGALQAACDQFGPEARALRDPVLASVYLDTTTPSARANAAAGHYHRNVRSTPGTSSHGDLHVLHRIA